MDLPRFVANPATGMEDIIEMLKKLLVMLLLVSLIAVASACTYASQTTTTGTSVQLGNSQILTGPVESQAVYALPAYAAEGSMSVEQALAGRRSRRNFQDRAISAEQLSQILWAAYGITSPRPDAPNLRGGLRTTPSAGALYPLEIYVIIGNVEGIEPGVFRYISEEHKLIRIADGDVRSELSDAALGQRAVREAPASIFYSAVFSRMTTRYGERGIRYAYIELGHSAQNVYLQAEALGLGTVAIGAFNDSSVRQILNLPSYEEPLYIMPIGYSQID